MTAMSQGVRLSSYSLDAFPAHDIPDFLGALLVESHTGIAAAHVCLDVELGGGEACAGLVGKGRERSVVAQFGEERLHPLRNVWCKRYSVSESHLGREE